MQRLALAQPTAQRARRATALLPWSPVLVGAAYLGVFAARFPELIERVYWDSDASTAARVAETLGSGTIVLDRYGWYTGLWLAALTEPLPFHRQLWEVAPYLASLGSVALLAWASWRLAGGWAAGLTATAAAATSPFVSYDLVTLNYHTGTWVATVVVAAYTLWVSRAPPVARQLQAAVLVTVLAGTSLASDYLFAFVGLIPLAATGLVLLSLPRLRVTGQITLSSVILSLPVAWVTTRAMEAANVDVVRAPTRFAADKDLWPNVGRLLRGIVQLVNGDAFFGAELGVRSALSFASAGLILVALAAPFVILRRELRSGVPSAERLAYATFWTACVVFNSAVFVFSSEGQHGGFYFVPILYAAAATVPLALAGTVLRPLAAVGVGLVALTSLVYVADRKTAFWGTLPHVKDVSGQIVEIAAKEGAPVGYADYWDASSLTWSTHGKVRVQPVAQCELPRSRALCPYWFNNASDWYRAGPTKSFVLRNASADYMRGDPPSSLGPPSAEYHLNDLITMFVYPYDIASRLDYSSVSWKSPSSSSAAAPVASAR
jgi:hypothetical protein